MNLLSLQVHPFCQVHLFNIYIPLTAFTIHSDSVCVHLYAAVPQVIPLKLLYTLYHFHLNRFAVLLLFRDHSSNIGQKVGVVVVVNKLEVVVRKRATTTAHLSGRLTAECGHALPRW